MSTSPSTFSSPLGPLHLAHPADQGSPTRIFFSLFRRNGSSTKSSSSSSSASRTLKQVDPSYNSLEYTLDRSPSSTYSSSTISSIESHDGLVPPPYTADNGLEEDLVVDGEEGRPEFKLETAEEKKQRLKAEKLDRKRRELIEADGRMDEALKSWGSAMPIETELTKALGIRMPIVQGGMMWVGLPKLVAAVSEAGGLGILTGLTAGSPENLRNSIREVRKLTSKPFAVNLTFLPSITPPPYADYAKVIIEEGVKVAETAGGPAAIPIVKMYKDAGIYVIHKCTSIRHAQTAERLGVNMLSIDGFECAGHPGEDDVGGLLLLAIAARKLKIPYIASGGIGDGRGLAAAIALGAQGINCGTLFVATEESYVHPKIKEAMVKADERSTTHIFRSLRNTARVFKNEVAKEVVAKERRPGGAEFPELAPLVSGARGKKVYDEGDPDAGVWSASGVMALIEDIPSVKTLMDRMEKQAEEILKEGASKVIAGGASSKL
ncbi:hypothetical protein JCM11641_002360 [Rhodosporidiobolus odoratus]